MSERPWHFGCGCEAKGHRLEALTLVRACAGHLGLLAVVKEQGFNEGIERAALAVDDGTGLAEQIRSLQSQGGER